MEKYNINENVEPSMNFIAQIKRFGMLMHRTHPEDAINPSLFHMLFTIYRMCRELEQQGISIGEITKVLEQTKPAMSQRLNTLEEKGYIVRIPGKEDRRRTDILVTPKGEQLIHNMEGSMNQYLLQLNKRMSQDKLERLTSLLEEAVEHMQDIMREEQ